jgi:carotenoid 1,2-hydratase
VAPGGYAWWYLDAISDDGRQALTIIAFIGSVFSPYYRHARRRAPQDQSADPLNHCAFNIAVYGLNGASGKRWAMTERASRFVQRSPDHLRIGASEIAWHGDALHLQLHEIGAPLPAPIRGRVRLHPQGLNGRPCTLSAQGNHRWIPIAPQARVELELDEPRLRWSGSGYFDSNRGDAPLERDFQRWDWARARLRDGRSAVLYDTWQRSGDQGSFALAFDADGRSEPFDPPAPVQLANSRFGIERRTRSEPGMSAGVERTLEDTPFYARSLVRATWLGEPVVAMHESLSLDRFAKPWVQWMLPFRMPRRW